MFQVFTDIKTNSDLYGTTSVSPSAAQLQHRQAVRAQLTEPEPIPGPPRGPNPIAARGLGDGSHM